MQNLKAVNHILASIAEIRRFHQALVSGFNLHRPKLDLNAKLGSSESHFSFNRQNQALSTRVSWGFNLHCPTLARARMSSTGLVSRLPSNEITRSQGLTLAHFKAQLEYLRDTSLLLELNLSTFGTRPRVNGSYGGQMSLS
jgi:hypothetical protein